ncbi:GNAT family protein [Brevibacterium daeguense]|uniref:GNAT family protein n=1 Tax=Brevibacterium daeguense TaxID=909936 RepID=A0ABP8EKJ4_9MICO|nr:GNAT family N-acetyltransferase [Brevibacterium daeguense]
MLTLEEIWPPFGITIRCDDITLSPVREADCPEIAEAAAQGVRADGIQAFAVPWDSGPHSQVARGLATYHWGLRAGFTREKWHVEFTVRRAGRVVGVQGIKAEHYPVTRVGTTGSWLGRPQQGVGTGTLMRQMIASAFFDRFGAVELYSGHLLGNEASRRVSEKCGYTPNGQKRTRDAAGGSAREQALVVTPRTLVRPRSPVEVTGAEAFAEFLGLPRDDD